jgi:serine/threonine protein kinase
LKFGDFLLLNAIGTGGSATVYKAIDVPLNRYIALKVLRASLATDSAFVARFSGAARAGATVNHPNIGQIYSFGEIDHWYYMAMELCDQGSLDDRITKLGRIPEMEVLTLGLQIASALRIAWQHGVLHRDVKPGNVLFNEGGVPKLVDYSLASGPDNDSPSGHTTDSELIWGTPYYVAPEKLRGRTEDERSDIYSLGATLFHALGGQPPPDSATATDAAGNQVTDPTTALRNNAPTAQERTIQVIARMLAQNSAERYGSYDEAVQDLMEAQDSLRKSQEVTPVAVAGRKRFAVLYLLGGLLLCGGIVWFAWKYGIGAHQSAHPSAPASGVPAHTRP